MPRRVALVVGVGQYESSTELNRLSSPVVDAQSICDVLGEYGDIEIIPLPFNRDQDGGFFINESGYLTADDLKQSISEVLTVQSVDAIDLAIFYFSGHAILQDDQVVWLAASDKPTAIAFSWLAEQIENSAVQNVCLWLDCCHSGDIFKHIDLKDKGFCVIAASHALGESIGIRDERSLMTDLLYKALIPGSENGREIRVLDLVKSIETQHKQLKLPQQILTHHGKTSFTLTRLDGEVNIDSEYPEGYPPYKGLLTFTDKDKDFFFGRDGMIQQLLDGLNNRRFVPVLGASGSGKSSLVLAGLLPALDKADWVVLEMRPTADPLVSLRDALVRHYGDEVTEVAVLNAAADFQREVARIAGNGQRLLLVIDQFEEVFTACKDEAKRATFINCLLEALPLVSELHVVVTLRSDFLGSCDDYPLLREHLQPYYPLGNLDAAGLREAISRPLALVGMRCEQVLEDELVSQTLREKGSLPLLQFVLEKLWELAREERSRELTVEMYQRLGGEHGDGLRGVLNEKADAFYQGLDAEQQRLMEWLMVELTQLGEGLEDTRRVVALQELYERQPDYREALNELIALVTKERLLVSDQREDGEATVAVAHEALIRDWNRVTEWLEGNREIKRWRSRVAADIEDWQATGGSLLRDGRLGEAETLMERYSESLLIGNKEALFINKGVFERKRERSIQKQRKRRTKQFASIMSAVSVLLLLSILSGWQLYKDKDTALSEKEKALMQAEINETKAKKLSEIANKKTIEARNNESKAEKLAEISNQKEKEAWNNAKKIIYNSASRQAYSAIHSPSKSNGYFEQGLLLAAASFEFNPKNITSISALSSSLQLTGNLIKTIYYSDKYLRNIKFSPDEGKILFSDGNSLQLWDIESEEIIQTWTGGHEKPISSFAYSPNGKWVVSGDQNGFISLWDAENGYQVGRSRKAHQLSVASLSFDSFGKKIISTGIYVRRATNEDTGSDLIMWNIEPEYGKFEKSWRVFSEAIIEKVVFSKENDSLFLAGLGGFIYSRDSTDGREIRRWKAHEKRIFDLAISPDGKKILSASSDKTLKYWDIESGEIIGEPWVGHESLVKSIEFSPNGKKAISGSFDRSILIWDTNTGLTTGPAWAGGGGKIMDLAVSKRGYIASVSSDKIARLWGRSAGHFQFGVIKEATSNVRRIAYHPSGKILFANGWKKKIGVLNSVDVNTLNKLTIDETFGMLEGHSEYVVDMAVSNDGALAISGDRDGKLILWDFLEKKPIGLPWPAHDEEITRVDFSHDNKFIASGSENGEIKIWDVKTKEMLKKISHLKAITDIKFSPNGVHLASSSYEDYIKLWDIDTGERVKSKPMTHKAGVSSIAFNHDGSKIASGGFGGLIKIWDANTGLIVSQVWRGHDEAINSIAFNNDSSRLISTSDDMSLRLWDVYSGQTLGEPLAINNGKAEEVVFTPNDSQVVSAGNGRYALAFWDVDPKSWVKRACNKVNRNFSHTEWQRFIGDALPYQKTCPDHPAPGDPDWVEPYTGS